MPSKYFKCNVTGGFKLTDLNSFIGRNEYFYCDSKVVQISKSIQAALKHKWIEEVTAIEATANIKPGKEIAPKIERSVRRSTTVQPDIFIPRHKRQIQTRIAAIPSTPAPVIKTITNQFGIITDLSDTTFLMPLFADSVERLRNLQIVLNYLNINFKTNIIICEQDNNQFEVILPKLKLDNLKIVYLISSNNRNDNIIHKTRLLNLMTTIVETPFICLYDVDVLFPRIQYVDALKSLKENTADFSYPYSQHFYDVPVQFHDKILEINQLGFIDLKLCNDLNENSKGGAVFWKLNSFIGCGMANENFISYGHEDEEMFVRARMLDQRFYRTNGYLYHLTHLRGQNSSVHNTYYQNNQNEFEKIKVMQKQDLINYVNSWDWKKNYEFA